MEVGFYDLFTNYVMELKWYGMLYVSMVWYVSTWYDVSIIGYCRLWYGMLVWYGVLKWYDVSMLWYVMLWFVVLVGTVL